MKTAITQLFSLPIALNVFGQQTDTSRLYKAVMEADRLIATDPRDFFRNVESFTVYDHGRITFAKYYHGTSKDSLHHIQSQTKSIVSLLLGIAIDKGFIQNENEPVARYFPEYQMVISFTEHNYTTPQVGPWTLRESILPNLEKSKQ